MAELSPADDPALALLLTRRSCHALVAPAPDDAELELILRAALRAPDFQHLRPFRFLAARGEGLQRLGAALQRAAVRGERPQAEIERAPRMPLRAPLVIVVIASPQPSDIVPVFDQELCAASCVLMMQLAACALGYGGVWRSGWPMYTPATARELGLVADERIVGFLYLGTPRQPLPLPAAEDPAAFLSWI